MILDERKSDSRKIRTSAAPPTISSYLKRVVRLSSVTELSMNATNVPSPRFSTMKRNLPVLPVSLPEAAASRAAATSSSPSILSFLPESTDRTSPAASNSTE